MNETIAKFLTDQGYGIDDLNKEGEVWAVITAKVHEARSAFGHDNFAETKAVDVLNAPLKDGAHEVRLVGNDAAHADKITTEDVQDLLGFTRDVLHSLYVVPARVAVRKKPRKT